MEKANAEARGKAEARIAAALEANKAIIQQRRQQFDEKQAQNESRRKYGTLLVWRLWHSQFAISVTTRTMQAEFVDVLTEVR